MVSAWRRASRRLTGASLAGLTGLAAVAVAVGAAAAAPITLSANGVFAGPLTTTIGDSVRLVAKAQLSVGSHIVIQVRRASRGTPLKVADCTASPCRGRWTEHKGGTVSFQALLVRAGHATGHSGSIAVLWQQAAPPAPPPPAPPPSPPPPPPQPQAATGHYCGLSNEGKSICFDLSSEQRVANLRTESVVTCGDSSRWLWTLTLSLGNPLQQLGFTYTYTGPWPSDPSSTNVIVTYTLAGTFDTAGNASGTIWLTHISWDSGGTHYECGGDPRTWTARLGA